MDEKMTQIEELLKKLSKMSYIRPEEIPDIDLYMDQVTTFMDTHLESSKRHPDDKILTKTMINNYAKNRLLPPPNKKKYSKDHMFVLLFIYYLKNILSISDIQSLLMPVCDAYFGSSGEANLEKIYGEILGLEKGLLPDLLADVRAKYETASGSFKDLPPEEQESMQQFAFICMLSFDVYLKKQIIETLIDKMGD